MVEVLEGDCLEVMRDIPDGSADMILCDLPYGTTVCKWDSVIPFEPLWGHYKRIIKRNGAIVLTASQPFTSALVMSNPKWFRCEWIWQKSNGGGFLNANRQPIKRHESLLVFSSGQPTYNPQKIKGKPYTFRRNAAGETTKDQTVAGWITKNEGDRYPTTVQYFSSESGLHPTQKPVALFEYLIRTYTNPGELVLDNCAGSGVSGVAAMNSGRRCILIEQDARYVSVIKQRLSQLSIAI